MEILSGKVDKILDFVEKILPEKIREEISAIIPRELDKLLTRPSVAKRRAPPTPGSNQEPQGSNVDIRTPPTNHDNLLETPAASNESHDEDPVSEKTNAMASNDTGESREQPADIDDAGIPWTEVVRKNNRRRNQETLIGTGTDAENQLEAATRLAWLYVGRLKQNTTEDILTNFLRKNGVSDIDCEQLNSIGRNKAFKVGIPFQHFDMVNKPEFWPAGVTVRRFRLRGSCSGVSLE